MARRPGNHEFPDHEKNSLDLDFLLLISCAFLHEFPFFKIKQQAGNSFARYLQRREKQFPEKQFLYLLRNRNECGAWILKHLQYRTSHMTLKKSNLGIHDASKDLNREINSQLDQIIFDLGIHNIDKNEIQLLLSKLQLLKMHSVSCPLNKGYALLSPSTRIPGSKPLAPSTRIPGSYPIIFSRIRSSTFFSIRETWTWEIPRIPAICC